MLFISKTVFRITLLSFGRSKSFIRSYWNYVFPRQLLDHNIPFKLFFSLLLGKISDFLGIFKNKWRSCLLKFTFSLFYTNLWKKNLKNPLTLDSSSRLTANTIDLEFFCIAVLQIASLRSVTAWTQTNYVLQSFWSNVNKLKKF